MVHSLVSALLAALLQVPPAPLPSPSPVPTVSPTPAAALSAQPASADHLYPGNTLRITFTNASGTLTPSIDNPLVTWTIDPSAPAITLTAGQTLGRATLTVADASGQSIQIPVRVGLDAGTILAQSISLRYTGNPVDPAWLQKNVQHLLTRNAQMRSGTPLQALQTTFDLPAVLAPGSISALSAQVQIAGNDRYYPVNAAVNVNLQNVPLPAFSPPVLMYDDDPEHIPTEGVLFRGRVEPQTPARLYYYHDNSQQPRDLAVVLTAQQTTDLHLVEASAGPNIDVMGVGHAVTREFLKSKPANQGVVLTLAAGVPQIIEHISLKSLQGAAGSIDMRILAGGPIDVTVLSVALGATETATDDAIRAMLNGPQLPTDGHNRTGVFTLSGYAADSLSYAVGGEDASVTYGVQTPPVVRGGHDYGEYGVWRTIDFAVTNPTGATATIYLFERPMGGPVRSSFLVPGSAAPVEVPCARASNKYNVAALSVPAGQSHVVIQTMTDGGSYYPLEVGLTATQPPPPPPINAPDGCFPKPQAAPSASPSPQSEPTGR